VVRATNHLLEITVDSSRDAIDRSLPSTCTSHDIDASRRCSMLAPLHPAFDVVTRSNPARPRTRLAAFAAAATVLAAATAASASCPGDLDHSGVVDGGDIGLVLLAWGTNDPAGDLDGDGLVGGSDIGLLLIGWGPCPCDEALEIEPLHDESTPQEPEILFETADALVTRLADRARDRHAREDVVNGVVFRKYDHWLPFYWEQRIAEIEIVDRVARGGVGVTFNFMTHDRLDPSEFRTFFADTDSVALYHNNMSDLPGQGVSLVAEVPARPSTTTPQPSSDASPIRRCSPSATASRSSSVSSCSRLATDAATTTAPPSSMWSARAWSRGTPSTRRRRRRPRRTRTRRSTRIRCRNTRASAA
jgi:hypothetical protein